MRRHALGAVGLIWRKSHGCLKRAWCPMRCGTMAYAFGRITVDTPYSGTSCTPHPFDGHDTYAKRGLGV